MRSPQPNFWTIQYRFLSSHWFFERKHLFFVKPLVIPKPSIPSVQLLGLSSKLYPSKMQRMFNKDLTRFMQSFQVLQIRGSEKQTCPQKKGRTLCGRVYHSAWYPDVSLLMKMCSQRKAGRRQQASRLPCVPFSWSLAVHHQSLVSRSPLPCEKRSA